MRTTLQIDRRQRHYYNLIMLRSSLLLILLAAIGCGTSGPQRASAGGMVLLDGKPIEQGSITFVPTDGTTGPTAGWAIKDGKYNIPKADGPIVGQNRVELRALRLTGKQIPNPMSPGSMMDEKVEAFPAEFNEKTTLVKEIVAGHNSLDFDLKSSPPPP